MAMVSIAGCNSGDAQHASSVDVKNKTIRIVTTTGMVSDIVRHVAGNRATVTGLIGSGVDPHLFKATRHDIKLLLDADVVFYSGLMLEGRLQDSLRQAHGPKRPVIAVTRQLEQDKSYLRSPPEFEGHYDPHVWMDVGAWSRCVDCVAQSLAEIAPEHAEEFRQNAQQYQVELEKLDEYVRQVIGSIPAAQRVLVTAHDAFGYFGRAYGIEVHSVQGVTTESEAGVNDVNRLVDFLVEKKLPAIFVESSVNEKNIQAVIEGTKARRVDVKIGAELFSDAMGAESTYEGTYIGMIDHNATKIARALGGVAPERGMQGLLSKTDRSVNAWNWLWSLPEASAPSVIAAIGVLFILFFGNTLRRRAHVRQPSFKFTAVHP